MNLENLKQILVAANILIKDRSKNFLCKCVYCGDHKDSKKQGHLYVSKTSNMPVAHCWFCGVAVPISKLISDLTGDKLKYQTVITDDEIQKSYNDHKKISPQKRYVDYKIPTIDIDSFQIKRLYIKKRTNNSIDIEKIPRLIFNFLDFFKLNNLDVVGEKNIISNFEIDLIQKNFVGFLSNHNTTLYCRNCDESSDFKFKKIVLQNESYGLLDYWSISVEDPVRNIVVLTEGNFNAIGEYISDSLNIKDKVKVYASGNTFSYGELLKSVCLDNNLYKANVIILSDDDKQKHNYFKFLKTNNHIIKECKIYINKSGKDFGIFPQIPIRIL